MENSKYTYYKSIIKIFFKAIKSQTDLSTKFFIFQYFLTSYVISHSPEHSLEKLDSDLI